MKSFILQVLLLIPGLLFVTWLAIGCATQPTDIPPSERRVVEVKKIKDVVMDPRWEPDGIHVAAYAIAEVAVLEYSKRFFEKTQETNLSSRVIHEKVVQKVPLAGCMIGCTFQGQAGEVTKVVGETNEAVFQLKKPHSTYVDVSVSLVQANHIPIGDLLSEFIQKPKVWRLPTGRINASPLAIPTGPLETITFMDLTRNSDVERVMIQTFTSLRYFNMEKRMEAEILMQERLIKRDTLIDNADEFSKFGRLLRADYLLVMKMVERDGLVANLIKLKSGAVIVSAAQIGKYEESDIIQMAETLCGKYAAKTIGHRGLDLGLREGGSWTSLTTGMEFVWIPALKIWVGKYEVTNGEYRKLNPSHDSTIFGKKSLNGDRQPVVYVNFEDAKAYAEWMTRQDRAVLKDAKYRLPSEAEWMTFAQCGDNREYPWGNAMPPKYGNYLDTASKKELGFPGIPGYTDGHAVTCEVEKSGMNDWGLYGVGGNVWECCTTDKFGSSFGAWRGGSWFYYCSPDFLCCACRNHRVASLRNHYNGFRLVLSWPSP